MEQNTKLEGIAKVVELVDYQDNAVVSRTIIDKKKAGTVTLFAFDEGQGLSEHTIPFDALVQILNCEAEVVISDEKFYPVTEKFSLCQPINLMRSKQ